MNNTPFNQNVLTICKPFQNEYGIIYLLKGSDLTLELERVHIMSVEENKFDQKDKICVQLDESQYDKLNEFIDKIKQKLSQTL